MLKNCEHYIDEQVRHAVKWELSVITIKKSIRKLMIEINQNNDSSESSTQFAVL